MGTRLYYKFYGDDLEDEVVFEARVDSLTREIGDRGKPEVLEAVPPSKVWALTPTPAPAPALVRTSAPARVPQTRSAAQPASVASAPASAAATAAAVVSTSASSLTPSMHQPSPGTQLQGSAMVPLLERLLEQAEATIEKQRQEMERLLEQAQATIEKQRQEMEKLRDETVEARVQAAVQAAKEQDTVSDEQLSALQARLESLHAAKLLTDDEFCALEDLTAEFDEQVAKLHRLVTLSEKMASDAGFSRQARRKFVS